MAIYRKTARGVWYYSIYVGVNADGSESRLRGSTGTADEGLARVIEQSLRAAYQHRSARERVMSIIDAIYGVDDAHGRGLLLRDAGAEAERIAGIKGRRITPEAQRLRRARMDALADWMRRHYPAVKRVADVDKHAALAYVRSLDDGRSVKTRRNIISDISTVWTLIASIHDGVVNPWQGVLPEGEQGRGRAYSDEQAKAIIKAADEYGHGWGLACRIGAATGLRLGDVLRLRHDDIVDGVAVVTPHKTARHGIGVRVPLPSSLLLRIGIGSGPIMPELLAEYESAGHTMRHPYREVLERAGVDPKLYTYHSWRHYFRSRLDATGCPTDVAMRLGGWTERTTAERYNHNDVTDEMRAVTERAYSL